jgi:hypothetical protein
MFRNPANAAAATKVWPARSRAIKNGAITVTLKRRYGNANCRNKETVRRQKRHR